MAHIKSDMNEKKQLTGAREDFQLQRNVAVLDILVSLYIK